MPQSSVSSVIATHSLQARDELKKISVENIILIQPIKLSNFVTGFCRDSVFSITAGHNSGALSCQCDYGGSLSFECEKFGGQCKCKDHIIGRRCEVCKTGYYGFPNCKPCNCPSSAYCEPSTGQCICPTHVTGEKCDQCEPLTYGYDQIIGCQECNCHPLGVNGSAQCDLFTGECP